MPHICTRCSNVFDSGEDILKGCPNCGWKKFMFTKKKPHDEKAQLHQQKPIITRSMGVRIPPRRTDEVPMATDKQMQALHKSAPEAAFDGKPKGKALESIKITAPGTYELNLPSLFERDELIMAVKEGTYFIDLTSAFKKGKKD
jgi:uncharacterized protein